MSNLSISIPHDATPETAHVVMKEFRETVRECEERDAAAAERRRGSIGFWGWLTAIAVTGAIVRVAASYNSAAVLKAQASAAHSALPAPNPSAASALPTHS